jgi:hypothetical protein
MCMRCDEKRHRTIFNILSLAVYTHYYSVFRIQIIKTMLNHCSRGKKGRHGMLRWFGLYVAGSRNVLEFYQQKQSLNRVDNLWITEESR